MFLYYKRTRYLPLLPRPLFLHFFVICLVVVQFEFSVEGSLSVSVLIISLCELHLLHGPLIYWHAKTTHDPKRTTTCISQYIFMYIFFPSKAITRILYDMFIYIYYIVVLKIPTVYS